MRILREDDLFALVAAPPAGAAAPSTRKRKRRRRSAAETSPLQEAAVRAVGGYPLSLFPESVVGRTKRLKLETLAAHLVTITDDLLRKIGVRPPTISQHDEIESSSSDEDEEEEEGVGVSPRVQGRQGGARRPTVTWGDAAAVAADDPRSPPAAAKAAAAAPASLATAMQGTDFVSARDVIENRNDQDPEEDATSPAGSASRVDEEDLGAGDGAELVDDAADDAAMVAAVEAAEAAQAAEVAAAEAAEKEAAEKAAAEKEAADKAAAMTAERPAPAVGGSDASAAGHSPPAQLPSPQPSLMVPESPLLTWDPQQPAPAPFGSIASASPARRPTPTTQGDGVLVPETQHTQAPRQEAPVQSSVFVPETQMPPVASAQQQASAAPAVATTAHAAMSSRERGAVLVPETQEVMSTSDAKVMGWLSQSAAAAEAANDGGGYGSEGESGRSTAPSVETASASPLSAAAEDDGQASMQGDEPAAAAAASPSAQRDEPVWRRRRRETRGFESSSSGDGSDDSDEEEPRWMQQRRRALAASMRGAAANPFAAGGVASQVSLNPTQPVLASILQQNAAPLPKKRARPISPPLPRRAGRRPRAAFSWTDKPQRPAGKRSGGGGGKQQRLTSMLRGGQSARGGRLS